MIGDISIPFWEVIEPNHFLQIQYLKRCFLFLNGSAQSDENTFYILVHVPRQDKKESAMRIRCLAL